MDSPLPRLRGRWDRVGILLSALCALHCMAGLVLVAALGIGGGVLLHPAIHQVGLVGAMLIAGAAIGPGAMRHRRPLPLIMALTGLAFMASALVVGHGSEEIVLTVIGVALVAIGHVLNLRQR